MSRPVLLWDKIPPIEGVKYDDKPDKWTDSLKDSFIIAHAQADLKEKYDRAEQRGKFAVFVKVFFVIWFLFVACMLVLDSISIIDVPELVLVTLLGTTSVNVIGLLIVLAGYYFGRDKRK